MFLWIAVAVICFNGGVSGQTLKTSSACYALSGCNDTMFLDCGSGQHVYVMKMQYGYKPGNSDCSAPARCKFCCSPGVGDCFANYTDGQFDAVYRECWHKQSCQSRTQNFQHSCPGRTSTSTFAVAHFSCLQSRDILDFHRKTNITAPAVAMHYNTLEANYIGDNQKWHCQVYTTDCVQRLADVILVKENYTAGHPNGCSSVGWSGGPFLSCVQDFRYLSFTTATPFRISVNVNKEARQPHGWAAVRSQDGTHLAVTCGLTNDNPSNGFSCSVAPPTTTTHDSLGGNTGPAGSVNTGAVVGGVVAVVVVLAAVAVAVYFVRRWRLKWNRGTSTSDRGKSSAFIAMTSGHSRPLDASKTSGAGHDDTLGKVDNRAGSPGLQDAQTRNNGISSATAVNQKYANDGKKPQLLSDHPTAPIIHLNPRSPVEDPDYDRLGGKKPQSSSSNPAATYSRLGKVGGGGEDTDYSYDHLARGRQAAPDVIDSDYSTSALNMTSEGDYNVADFQKGKQHVITGSDYDVAQIVTSEGDYNRVDFQGRNQHVITGSDYDTAEIVTSEGDYNRVDFQGEKQHVITESDYDTAEMVTSEGNYNRVDFQERKKKVITGSVYDVAEVVTSCNAEC